MLRGRRNTLFLGKAWETHRSHTRCHLQGTNSPAHQGHCPFVSPIIQDRQKEEWLQLCRGQSPEGPSEGFVRLGEQPVSPPSPDGAPSGLFPIP